MKRLAAGGIDRDQAEAHAEAINEYLRPDLATKDDIAALRIELRSEIATGFADIKNQISTLRQEMAQRETRSIGIIVAIAGLLFVLLKFTP